MLVLEQWLVGRDVAGDDATAAGMANFVYLVACDATRRAWLVDPAWNVDALVAAVERAGYALDGALLTHWHPDHAGGDLWGIQVEGAAYLRERTGVAIHAHRAEAEWLARSAGLAAEQLTLFDDGDTLALGTVQARCVHAPGHTPGSTCYWIAGGAPDASRPGHLLTGDVLFVGGVGRVDLPGSDPAEMFRTLHERLATLPGETELLPGHDYGPSPRSTLAAQRRDNPYLQVPTLEAWLAHMG